MMRLLCNGRFLDLYDNASLQFTHTNPLFAFDKMECERTTQFKLPATPTNDSVFGLCRLPAYDGTGMQRKFSAQLQAGTVVKDGYLYVSEYDGKDYAAIFVTGDLIGLQAIKNAGNIGDYYSPNSTATYGVAATTPAVTLFQTLLYSNSLIEDSGLGRYSIDSGNCRPCISLYVLLVQGLQQIFGFSLPTPASDIQNLVYIPENYVDSNGDVITTQGDTVYLSYNMPEWTGVQLIKMIADLSGRLPNYEKDTLTFVKDLTELAAPMDITPIITKRGKVTRTLEGFSKNNYIRWEDGEAYGEQIDKAYADYYIDNDNIQEERDLATIPAQPALYVSTSTPSLSNVALLWDTYANDYFTAKDIVPLGKQFIARWDISSGSPDYLYLKPYGTYANIVKNPILSAMCSYATQIKVECRMSLLEYYKITNLSTVLVDNTRYIWLERSWQKDTASFTLVKVG